MSVRPSALLARSDRAPDRGASAVFIGITMLFLIGLSAVVIDGGIALSERRQAQSGVDFASLAALQAAVGVTPEDAGANEAIAVVAANLPGRTLLWGAGDCDDPDRPLEYSIVSSVSPCVSFTPNFEKARVRLPVDEVDTTFGRIIGFDTLDVRTTAEAIQTINSTADILPHTAGQGAVVCLFSNQAPQTVPPCDGPFSGFFGYIDVALYGSTPLDNPFTCEQGTSNVRSAINIAKGSDHIMAEWNNPDPVLNDHAECPNRSENINELVVQPGSPTNGATDGLIRGVSGSINGQPFGAAQGRLQPSPVSTATTTVRGFTLDDVPLWNYLTPSARTCSWTNPGDVTGTADSYQEIFECLDDWNPGVGSIFQVSLDEHLRFGAIPIFVNYPTGPGSYLIDEFVPVWIETIYQNCNANACRTIFSPGEPGDTTPCPANLAASPTINCGHNHTSGPDTVEGVTAFRLDVRMLHEDTQEFFPGSLSLRELSLLK